MFKCEKCKMPAPFAEQAEGRSICLDCFNEERWDRYGKSDVRRQKDINQGLMNQIYVITELLHQYPEHLPAVKDFLEMPWTWWARRDELSMAEWIKLFYDYDVDGYWLAKNKARIELIIERQGLAREAASQS